MADCPNCGRLLDGGKCARCRVIGVVETTEQAAATLENTAQERPARKSTRKKG